MMASMAYKIIAFVFVFILASGILTASILRSAAVRYSFRLQPSPTPTEQKRVSIDYELPYPGRVTPTSILWPVKVIRDKTWLFVTTNNLKKAEISLLLADKRLSAGMKLFELSKAGDAITVIMKGEYYLDESLRYVKEAHKEGMETKVFLHHLALSALKHREVLETLRIQAPEDAQPIFNKTTDYSKNVYEQASHIIREMGDNPPSNPFGD
jgi:hypothetical protein